jgi:hypothetical protein
VSGLGLWACRLCFCSVDGWEGLADTGVGGLVTTLGDLESGSGNDAELTFASLILRFDGRFDSVSVLRLESDDCGLVSELVRADLGRSREPALLESGVLAILVPSFARRGRIEPDVTVWLLTTFWV